MRVFLPVFLPIPLACLSLPLAVCLHFDFLPADLQSRTRIVSVVDSQHCAGVMAMMVLLLLLLLVVVAMVVVVIAAAPATTVAVVTDAFSIDVSRRQLSANPRKTRSIYISFPCQPWPLLVVVTAYFLINLRQRKGIYFFLTTYGKCLYKLDLVRAIVR